MKSLLLDDSGENLPTIQLHSESLKREAIICDAQLTRNSLEAATHVTEHTTVSHSEFLNFSRSKEDSQQQGSLAQCSLPKNANLDETRELEDKIEDDKSSSTSSSSEMSENYSTSSNEDSLSSSDAIPQDSYRGGEVASGESFSSSGYSTSDSGGESGYTEDSESDSDASST